MLKMFAVFDSKAESYGTPMFVSTKGLALRGFADACADPSSALAMHPADYVLYEVGSYEPNSGKLTDITPAVFVVAASSVVDLLKSQQPAPAAPIPGSVPGDLPLKDGEK